MRKSLLALLLSVASLASAAATDVNVVNTYVPAQQYGNWSVSINNLPPNFGATQNGLWNVGQYGQWYVGQYGNWNVNVTGGSLTMTTSASGLTITPAGGSLTVTVKSGNITVTAGSVFPVSIVAGTLSQGTLLQVTSTSTISTTSGTTQGQTVFSLPMGYDSGTGTWRRTYLGSAGDNTSAILFPGSMPYGVYNASGVTLTTGNVARLQFDQHGKLLVSTNGGSGGDATAANQTTQIGQLATLTTSAATLNNTVSWNWDTPTASTNGLATSALLYAWDGTAHMRRLESTTFGDLRVANTFADGRPYYSGDQAVIDSAPVVISSGSSLPSGSNILGAVGITSTVNADDLTNYGFINAAGNGIGAGVINGQGTVAVQLLWQTTVGSVEFQGTVDGTNWTPIRAVRADNDTVVTTASNTDGDGIYYINSAGLANMRVWGTSIASGPLVVYITVSTPTNAVAITSMPPVTASLSGGITVTNTASNAVQVAGSITNTVGIVGTAADGGAWTDGVLVIGGVTGSNLAKHLALDNGGNLAGLPSLAAGTAYIGAVGISGTALSSVTITSMPTVTATLSGGVTVTNTATNAVQIAGSITNTVTVGTHAVTQSGTWTVVNGGGNVSLTAGTAYIGAVNVSNTATSPVYITATGAGLYVVGNGDGTADGDTIEPNLVAAETYPMVFNGSTWDRLRGTTSGMQVQGPVSPTVTAAGNPVYIGGKTLTITANLATNSDGAMTPFMTTKSGKMVTALNGPREIKGKATITLSTNSETTLVAAGSSGIFNDIDSLVASNGSTQTVRVDFRDATAGSVVFSCWLAANGGGFVLPVGTSLVQTTAANNWTAQLSAGTASNDVRILATYHQTK
jgi:hypothetical protein